MTNSIAPTNIGHRFASFLTGYSFFDLECSELHWSAEFDATDLSLFAAFISSSLD